MSRDPDQTRAMRVEWDGEEEFYESKTFRPGAEILHVGASIVGPDWMWMTQTEMAAFFRPRILPPKKRRRVVHYFKALTSKRSACGRRSHYLVRNSTFIRARVTCEPCLQAVAA